VFAVKMCVYLLCGKLASGGGCLFMRNVAKSSAVRVNEGGGGDVLRREEMVLKSM